MSASYPVKLILAFRSGNKCALPKCARPLTADGESGATASTGEAAHIAGEKPDAARYDPSMTDGCRNDFPNLIYLCGDCHTKIDKLWVDWPVDLLKSIKSSHESKVDRVMEEAFANVDFPELEKAMSWLASVEPAKDVVDFSLLTPEAKIQKNALSNGARHIITAGLSSRNIVSQFVEAEAKLDPDYPERLKSGFLSEYHKLRGKSHRGNELFELMCVFAQRGCADQTSKIAGLAVLVYLFELCDVFEK